MKYFTFRDWLSDISFADLAEAFLMGIAFVAIGLLLVGLK